MVASVTVQFDYFTKTDFVLFLNEVGRWKFSKLINS